eukprot:CAMPEP_0118684512 /NCGR_PEP_ID=MMETSP0800-20121206/6685_1 /TAXON_ID=210618 ORGANISM="Striatella unipunctata, Strain CCMP2910" /NCGR_SAMPLE_ID=MMETSP0800 /ASSEMBLY_ACC=CAM_ASM_000638 /LENGTH=142 /DNA_ID=CAMNT_0006581227 /DNA_START=198 /DNA_END=626 /DNA_ORIENTATION=+
MGWHLFFEGWMSSKWAETQQAYYEWLGMRRTGHRWVQALIKKLWQTAWDLWEHRNSILHHQDSFISIEAAETLNEMVRNEFDIGVGALPTLDHYLFGGTLYDLLNKPHAHKQLWLSRVETAWKSQHLTLQSTLHQERCLLRS